MPRVEPQPEVNAADISSSVGGTPAERAIVRWVMPDVALLFAMLTLFFLLVPFDGTHGLFRDSDAGWHIRTGERILNGSLPRQDTYSFTRSGQTWFAWEWGSDALMGWAHKTAGLSGVALLFALTLALCTWLWVKLSFASGGDFFLTCLLLVPLLVTVNIHWLARPHLFSWVFLAAALLAVQRAPGKLRAWHAAAAVAFASVWANMHASFFMLICICLLYCVAYAVRPFLWETDARSDRAKARWFAAMAACTLAGTFVNPYGWQVHRHILSYLGNSEMLARVAEFQSFNFHAEGAWAMIAIIGLGAAGGLLALYDRRLGDFALLAGLTAMAIHSARMIPLLAMAGLPLACGAATQVLRGWRDVRPGVRHTLDRILNYSAKLQLIDGYLGGFATAMAIPVVLWFVLQLPVVSAKTGFPGTTFPLKAVEAVARLPRDARIVAPDWIGGYLIYRFNGERKVYFDGRSDFYGTQYLLDYLTMMDALPGWDKIFQQYRFTHALIPNKRALLAALEKEGWRRLAGDDIATLLERPAPTPAR